jgi:DNA-binding CsgD family transcriptional regulator
MEAARAAVLAASDAETRFAGLARALGSVGFDQINYGFFDPEAARRDDAEVIFLSTMSTNWLEHYYANDLHLTDPHVHKVREGNLLPYMWGDSEIGALAERTQRQTALRIAEAGQRSAICTPLASPFAPRIPVAGLTLGSSMSEHDLAGVTGLNALRLITLVHLFHHLSIGELHRRRIGAIPLTQRERDCLRYSADGLQQESIGKKLGLARVTVETHLRNAKRKLKARSLAEAIARGIVFGEIPLE